MLVDERTEKQRYTSSKLQENVNLFLEHLYNNAFAAFNYFAAFFPATTNQNYSN